MHGTRAVQKLLECFTEQQQVDHAIHALEGNVVTLIKDINGNHVIQRCLQRLRSPEDIQVWNSGWLDKSGWRQGCLEVSLATLIR